MKKGARKKKEVVETIHAEFTCYSCNRMCSASVPGDISEDPTIHHEMPMCKEFEKVKTVDDGVSFLKRCRQRN